MKKNDLREKIHLTSVDELFGLENAESSIEIGIDRIRSFKDHPFKVLDDDKMADLVESIKANGVLTPVVVRGNDGEGYEMISGHRRLHASKLAGLKKIPAFVRELSDDEATIVMVDSNIQREELLPSEKAFALRMKLEAMSRQGKRTDLTSSQNGTKLDEEGADNGKTMTLSQNGTKFRTAENIGAELGMSRNQVYRYIRLTELIPELLDLVDKKRLQFTCAVDISYFDKIIQKWLNEYIRETVVGKGGSMTISGQQYPRELVKSRFLKLNMSHVEYVMECLRKNTTKVYNIKAYLLAALFNAGTTMSNYYRAEVNHDMPQFAG